MILRREVIRAGRMLAPLFVLSLLLAGLPGPGLAKQEREEIDLRELESGVRVRINEYRASVKKPPFESNEMVAEVARDHSRNMARGKVDRSSGFVDAALKQGLGSAVHKKNIDGDYDLAGIGAARAADGVVYFTQIFVKKR